jgi:hypothetical protein
MGKVHYNAVFGLDLRKEKIGAVFDFEATMLPVI